MMYDRHDHRRRGYERSRQLWRNYAQDRNRGPAQRQPVGVSESPSNSNLWVWILSVTVAVIFVVLITVVIVKSRNKKINTHRPPNRRKPRNSSCNNDAPWLIPTAIVGIWILGYNMLPESKSNEESTSWFNFGSKKSAQKGSTTEEPNTSNNTKASDHQATAPFDWSSVGTGALYLTTIGVVITGACWLWTCYRERKQARPKQNSRGIRKLKVQPHRQVPRPDVPRPDGPRPRSIKGLRNQIRIYEMARRRTKVCGLRLDEYPASDDDSTDVKGIEKLKIAPYYPGPHPRRHGYHMRP